MEAPWSLSGPSVSGLKVHGWIAGLMVHDGLKLKALIDTTINVQSLLAAGQR